MLPIRNQRRLVVLLEQKAYSQFNNYPFIILNEWYYRDVAQFGSALRSGHGTIQFISIEPNSHNPFNTATYGDLKNKIHVVKQVLTTCYPTDTGI